MAKYYLVRKEMDYAGRHIEANEVIELAGMRNDERLIKHGHLVEYTGTVQFHNLPQCGECGAVFANDAALFRHGAQKHKEA